MIANKGEIMLKQNLLKKSVIFSLLFFCLSGASAQAFLFEITVQDKAAIKKLSDEKLVDTYIDAMIELEASDKFYSNTGLKPKEYAKYKKLLRFRTDLILEFQRREFEPPKIK